MRNKSPQRMLVAAATLLGFASLTACKPDNIFFTVTNQSGYPLHDVKVTYPDDELDVGTIKGEIGSMTVYGTYRHFTGPGDLAVSYTTESGIPYSHSGPHVNGDETGGVKINIDGNDATFETNFDASPK